MPSNGRPLKPLDPDAPVAAARFAAELRKWRLDRGLTQAGLAAKVGCAAQQVSEVERARVPASARFALACDLALETDGALTALQPAVVLERAAQRERRAAARADPAAALRYEDVDPTNRRGILGTAAGAALGTAMVGPAPARAREIDPGLVDHWTDLLSLLGRLDAAHGPRDVLAAVVREIGLIAEHRAAARSDLRTELMRVEARWCEFAAWLSNDVGDARGRNAWTERAAHLAQTAGYADMAALTRERRALWAAQALDARRTIAFAEDGLRIPGTSAQTRALCVRQAACGHALGGDIAACERRLAEVEAIMDRADATAPPWTGGLVDHHLVRSSAARCWLALEPSKAIPLYDDVLRAWPRGRVRTGGLQRARLALACAKAGELDRARAEGARALAVARSTNSATTMRELRRLGGILQAA